MYIYYNNKVMDNSTLEFLTNPIYQKKIDKDNNVKKDYEREKNFYKKRILFLTKELISNNDYQDKDIKHFFDQYCKSAIELFKITDKRDIIQEEYCNLKKDNIYLNENNVIETNPFNLKPTTLDNFVTKVIKNENITYPQTRDIDLFSQDLKLKGVSLKKENI